MGIINWIKAKWLMRNAFCRQCGAEAVAGDGTCSPECAEQHVIDLAV